MKKRMNKKKKKGFTLIELLAVLAILFVLIGLSVGAYVNVREQTLEKQYSNVVSRIETAAEKYANETSITTVSVEQLIKEGYLQADDETNIYDPRDKKSLNCYIVTAVYKNEEYIATLGNDLGNENGVCNSYEVTSNYTICEYDVVNKTCKEINNTQWFKDNITLGVMTTTGNVITDTENYEIEWSTNTGLYKKNLTVSTDVKLAGQIQYKVRIKNGDTLDEATKIIRVDKQAPSVVIKERNLTNPIGVNYDLKENIEATDFNGSGIDKIECYVNGTLTEDISSLEAGDYKIQYKVIDKVGNESSSSESDEITLKMFVPEINLDYTGEEIEYIVPISGPYEIELIGAQGSNNGGKGAYLLTEVNLEKGDILKIAVGGQNGYNGGGIGPSGTYNGGGATTIKRNGSWLIRAAGGGGGSDGSAGGNGTGTGGNDVGSGVGASGTNSGGGSSSPNSSEACNCRQGACLSYYSTYPCTAYGPNSACGCKSYATTGSCAGLTGQALTSCQNAIGYPVCWVWNSCTYATGGTCGGGCASREPDICDTCPIYGKSGNGGSNYVDVNITTKKTTNGFQSGNGSAKLKYILD